MKRIFLLLFGLFSVFALRSECDTLFYMHRLNQSDLDQMTRLHYLDTLLKAKKSGREQLLIDKVEVAYDLGIYDQTVNAYQMLIKEYPEGRSLSENLKLRLHYAHGLHYTKRFMDCLTECRKMLRTPKPDSLRYYDTLVDCQLLGFNSQTAVTHSKEYIARNEALYEEGRRKGWPKATLDLIKFGCFSMKLNYAFHTGDFERALMITDSISRLPLSSHRQHALSTNMAYLYMRLGKYDLAEEYFTKLLVEPQPSYEKAVTLMNYTHMLNLQGRYQETLDLLDQFKDIAKELDQEIYGSYILGNQAVAESHTLGYEKAFNTLMRSKELGDSVSYTAQLQDGLLLVDYEEQSNRVDELENEVHDLRIWLYVILGVLLLTGFALYQTSRRIWRVRTEKKELEGLLTKSRASCQAAESAYAEISREGDGRMAARMLEASVVEQSLEKIGIIIMKKNIGDTEKLKKIEELITAADAKHDSREKFEHHFDQAHARFFRELYAAHPDLTQSEVRLCAYIIMNLSNKEIAELTNKSVRSVESSRYRIGKKLMLPEGETLVSYLRSFLKN